MHLQEEQIFFYDKLWYINQRNILLFLLGDQNVMDVCVTEYTTPQMCSVCVRDAASPASSTVNGTTPVKIIKVLNFYTNINIKTFKLQERFFFE